MSRLIPVIGKPIPRAIIIEPIKTTSFVRGVVAHQSYESGQPTISIVLEDVEFTDELLPKNETNLGAKLLR